MWKDASLAAGGDLQLTYTAMTGAYEETDTAIVQNRMRKAAHRVLYTVANSNAMNGVTPGSRIIYGIAPWQYAVWGASAVLGLIALGLGFVSYKRLFKLKKNSEDVRKDVKES